MLVGLGVLLGLAVVAPAFHLRNGENQKSQRLQKRDWVLECDATPVPVERQGFDTMGDMCKGYPHGFGLICDNNGHIIERLPRSLLVRTYGNDLAHVCLNHCECSNIAPDAPTVREAEEAQFNECSMSNATEEGQGSEQHDQPSTSATCSRGLSSTFIGPSTCNEYWYGNPVNADCTHAMRQLPDHGTTTSKLRELLPDGQSPSHPGAEAPSVSMPILSTFGQCSIAVMLPEGQGMIPSMIVDTLELNRAADGLREHCVQSHGVGGKFNHMSAAQREQASGLPDIVMYAPDSKWKDFLEVKYQCLVEPKGSSKCKSSPKQIPRTKGGAYGAWKYMGTIGSQGWQQVPPENSNRRKCGGSCLNPTDCDVNSDCLCASTKGMLLSSTWGQHSCTYVAGAAAAISAMALKQPVCRGRCLLHQSGVTGPGASLNASNTTFSSLKPKDDPISIGDLTTTVTSVVVVPTETVYSTVVLGNETGPVDENVPAVATSDSSTALGSYPDPSPTGAANSNSETSASQSNESMGGLPIASNDTENVIYGNVTGPPPEYAIFNDTSTSDMDPLTCPCNCTYVSAACCLSDSGIVYENPSMQVPVTPIPDDDPICCDPRTGQFLWRLSGECNGEVINGTADNFIELGDRLWNSTFDNRVGFPDDESGHP